MIFIFLHRKFMKYKRYLDGGVLTIYDHPWPGFTPDLLSIVLVTAIQAKGSVLDSSENV